VASDPRVAEVLRRVRFLTASRRWRSYEGGLAEALVQPRAAFLARWPVFDPDAARRAKEAAKQAQLAEAARLEAAWVGPQHLAPGTYEALRPRARAAADSGRLAELQRLAHTSPDSWERVLRRYRPRSLEFLLLASDDHMELLRYAAECVAGRGWVAWVLLVPCDAAYHSLLKR
jgi:hypothetical protein